MVSDIMMPGRIDGIALARSLRSWKQNSPVLLVTGYSQAAAAAAKECIILSKPFKLAELSRVAARMIAEARQPPTSNLVRLQDVRRNLAGGSADS